LNLRHANSIDSGSGWRRARQGHEKDAKEKAVSKYTKKNGKKVKAYTKNA